MQCNRKECEMQNNTADERNRHNTTFSSKKEGAFLAPIAYRAIVNRGTETTRPSPARAMRA
jgi:hypothetical protein